MPTIGKYEILEQLGSGSMGTVYKGRDSLLDRMVAIKTIRTGVNVELEAKERFYREARTCAQLNHPHIVSVFDLGEENGTSFIAMELLTGSDFRQLIERREPLALGVKLTAMAQVCEGLAHAHREGIIHRDIKPSNLFLLKDGRAKVVDFGIAKLPTSHLTRAGAILGTPNYMAPEQISGTACDGRADLFSAAVVFFEFLTFEHPFKSNLIPRRILDDNPDSLFKYDPSLPRILEKIFARALSKKPDQRYATGDQFAADLRSVVDAISRNASPTFSGVELPSTSSIAVPPTIPLAERTVPQANGGPDNHEWRVNRMLKLLPAFEAEVAARDSQRARNTLAEMQSVAGEDSRYRESIENCRLKLLQMESSQAVTSARVRCQKCANINPAEAAFCVGCGAALPHAAASAGAPGTQAAPPPPPPANPPLAPPPLFNSQQASGSGSRSQVVNGPKTASASASTASSLGVQPGSGLLGTGALGTGALGTGALGTSSREPLPIRTVPPPKPAIDRSRVLAIAAVAVVAVALLLFVPGFFRSVKEEPYVATARVAAQKSRVAGGTADSSKTIASINRGDRVNVLTLPASLYQGSVKVQARLGAKFSEAGFAKAADLNEWESKNPAMALTLARMSGPMENGTEAEMRAQVDRLNSVAASFAGKPAAGEASLDAARLEVALAKRAKEANPDAPEWRTGASATSTRLETLRKDPALQAAADGLTQQIQEMLASTPAPVVEPPAPPAPPPLTDAEVRYLLNEAQQAFKGSRYNDALSAVGRVLFSRPQNSDAQALRRNIIKQRDFENGH